MIKSDHTMNLVGTSIEFLKFWLEWQFQFDKNINWDNYGSYFHIRSCEAMCIF